MPLEIDPFDALALSLHHSPGVYALMVGSGLSRAAGIQTGWEITLDLIRRLAALGGVTEHPNWQAWYTERHGREPNYSEILDALAATPSERRAILHEYIDPKPEEDTRRPTTAHRAIAKLVVDGTIKVIITTNFDRLLENALRDAGIEPTVIASEDALAGATPLVHSRCTVIKLHGDYLDTRIKNTEAELETYPPAINACLDEVFDRFGLLVVGWSGEWDIALRAALLRAPNRRYPLYWAARGQIATLADELVGHRAGSVIQIADADSFFRRLSDTLDALKTASRPHPQTVSASLALVRKYCRDDKFEMEWNDFLQAEVDKIHIFVTSPEYPNSNPSEDNTTQLANRFLAVSEVIRKASLLCARWGTVKANHALARSISKLVFFRLQTGGYIQWTSMRKLAASLCFYWAVGGALEKGDYELVKFFFDCEIPSTNSDPKPAIFELPLIRYDSTDWRLLRGLSHLIIPSSVWMSTQFAKDAALINVDETSATELFDQLEFSIGLDFAHRRRTKNHLHFWAPPGMYFWRAHGDYLDRQIATYSGFPADHPALQAGLFGGSPGNVALAAAAIREFSTQLPR